MWSVLLHVLEPFLGALSDRALPVARLGAREAGSISGSKDFLTSFSHQLELAQMLVPAVACQEACPGGSENRRHATVHATTDGSGMVRLTAAGFEAESPSSGWSKRLFSRPRCKSLAVMHRIPVAASASRIASRLIETRPEMAT